MALKRKRTYLIGIAVALLLPLFSFLVFQQVSKGKIKIPEHYGIDFIDTLRPASGQIIYDTIYRTVEDITLTNQLNQPVRLNEDLRGKILVINFFDSQDTTSIAVMRHMHNVERRFQEKAYQKPKQDNLAKVFQLVSIALNPYQDQVSEIRTFADDHQINSDRWWLLTGDSTAISRYASVQLGLPSVMDGGSSEALSRIILVDTFRHIRGYFNGLEAYQLSRLADDISIISMEKRDK